MFGALTLGVTWYTADRSIRVGVFSNWRSTWNGEGPLAYRMISGSASAVSTSGASPNVLRAIDFANSSGAITLAVTGRQGLPLQTLAHHTLVVQSTSVQQIEDATMVAGHLLCLRVRELIAHGGQHVMFKEKVVALPGLRAADAVS